MCKVTVFGASFVVGCLAVAGLAAPVSAAAQPDPPGTAQVTSVPVTAFSLSDQRLVDNDARPVRGVSVTGTYNTKVTTINVHTGVGNTGTVHRPTAPDEVQASGAGTAFLLGDGQQDVTRVVRTSHGTFTVRHTLGERWFTDLPESSSLSGNRYVYAVEQPANHYRAYLLDTSTGRRTLVQGALGYGLPVVFGDFVASQHADGSVWRRNLVTGESVQVSPSLPLPVNAARLFIWGDYVGWNISTGDDDEGAGPSASYVGYRDVKTMAPAHTLTDPIAQLSSAGVVVRHPQTSSTDSSYSLETYDGTSVPLLPAGSYRLPPQVAGRAMAWADADGLLKIAQLDVPLANPRYLGAPYEPATSINNPTRSHYWTATLPFAGTVTNCSVQIRYGARVIQNRSCGAARIGELQPTWNAIAQDGGPVRAGTYHVRLYSPEPDPSTVMLNADGDARPIDFTVRVGHATRVTLRTLPARIRRGSASVLSAHLTTTLGSKHAHRKVVFSRRLADGTWHRIGTRTTSAAGTARLRVKPRSTAVYRAQFTGSRVDRPSASVGRRVRVHR